MPWARRFLWPWKALLTIGLLMTAFLGGCKRAASIPPPTVPPIQTIASPAAETPRPTATHTVSPVPTRPSWPTQAGPMMTLPAPAATPTAMVTPMPMASSTPYGALYEPRLLTVEWPPRLRQGDGDWIRLALLVDEQGNVTPTVTQGGHTISGEPMPIPNLYDTHVLFVRARLDAAGLLVEPHNEVTEELQPGEPLYIYWTVRGEELGRYRAVLTAHLVMEPKAGGRVQTYPLAYTFLDMEVVNFLGLSGFWVRVLGVLSGLFGLILNLPDLLDLWQRLFRKKRD